MTLRRVQVTDFRCLRSAEFELDPRFTLFTGRNASGKTSLLEAIYVLGRGRSFRTRRLEKLIRAGADRFVVFGEAVVSERHITLGVEGSASGIRGKMAGERVATLAELAAELPVQIIDPEVHRLIEEGPSRRRRFLDWGVFHVEHHFVGTWQGYQQVLKQRNAALRSRQPAAAVRAWDGDLIRLGNSIHEARIRYLRLLSPGVSELSQALLGLPLSMTYRPGWSQEVSLEDALKTSWTHDQEAGVTQVGPQRAELALRLEGAPVKDRISRGQQKLLAASLLMAQLSLFPSEGSTHPTLLLDDPAAELDGDRLMGLIREVAAQSVQLVVTSLSPDFKAFGTPGRQYAVTTGEVVQIS